MLGRAPRWFPAWSRFAWAEAPTGSQARWLIVVAAIVAVLAGVPLALIVGERGESSSARASVAAPAARLAGSDRLPIAARVPVSQALGSDERSFWVARHDGALFARNSVQGFVAGFSQSGVVLSVRGGRIEFSLRALGYRSRVAPVPAPSPWGTANRVSYARKGLSEWYVNGPLGIEQGFTLAAPPSRVGAGPLTLALRLGGSFRARLEGQGAVTFAAGGRPLLRYGGLRVTDARGRLLPASLSLGGDWLSIHVEDAGARYPVRVDPFIQGTKLTGGGASGGGQFGWSVALSSDGSTALIGGPQDNSYAGAAWVFTRSGATWRQQGPKLTAGDETGGGQFGSSVALSSDGNTALIGGPQDNSYAGAAWVFTRSRTSWVQQGPKLTGSGAGSEGSFGSSVGLSADGGTALIGAVEGNLASGAVVFTRSGAGWSKAASLTTGSPGSGGSVAGVSTALSADGNTALIGGNYNNLAGAAWVFTRSGATWRQQGGRLTGSGESGPGQFGLSGMALSADGNTALIGGADDNGGTGAAWVFTRYGAKWSQQSARFTAAPNVLGFGFSVALSAGGGIALIGAPETLRGSTPAVGAAWLFTRSRSRWSQQRPSLTGGSSEGLGFGASVALSSAGTVALIGGTSQEAASSGVGSAWVFVSPPNTKITMTKVDHEAHSARFSFKAIGVATSGFQCALVREPAKQHHKRPKPSFSACRSPKTYRHLKAGNYAFLVRALDVTVRAPRPASRSFEIR